MCRRGIRPGYRGRIPQRQRLRNDINKALCKREYKYGGYPDPLHDIPDFHVRIITDVWLEGKRGRWEILLSRPVVMPSTQPSTRPSAHMLE